MRSSVVIGAVCAVVALCPITSSRAQDSTASPRPWYDRLTIRGYAQFRYNRLLETNEKLKCPTCDRSIGERGGFFLRRARLSVAGEVTDRVSVSIQTDFASEVAGRENGVVLRHYYADIFLDSAKTFRARVGQSEVPSAFEALQSSSRRAPFDRADVAESGAPGEQDLGVFFMWTPTSIRKRIRELATPALKGAGDYGAVAIGLYNGQGGNRAEANDEPHAIARIAFPFQVRKQNIEIDAYAYKGTYTIANSQRAAGVGGKNDFDDYRIGGSFIIYPQPLGLQAEWAAGRGPQYDAPTNSILGKPVKGGYALLTYALSTHGERRVAAYTRAQYFQGSFKTDPDARGSIVHEYEPGIEWAIDSGIELSAAYAISDRFYRESAAPANHQKGRFLRLQAQFSF